MAQSGLKTNQGTSRPAADRISCLKCGTSNSRNLVCCLRCGANLRNPKVENKDEKKNARLASRATSAVELCPTDPATEVEVATDRIYCGDCLDVLRLIPADSVDLVVTSPPYNFGLDDYDTHRDTRTWEDYFSNLGRAFAECHRVLKNGGRICVIVQPFFSDYMPTHHIISQQLRDLGWLFKAEIVWEKHNWNCKYTAWGSWKSPSMPYLKYTWEFIEVFCKGSQRKPGSRERIDITADEFKKWVYAKWEIAPESRMKQFDHPSMFPEELPYRLIRLFSFKGDLVLDPFNGVGTTTLVARKLQRKYIGIDISRKYCEIAEKRIEEYEQQLRLF